MASYNSLDGLPASANPWLLTDVLRGEWGFRGFVVSDYGSAAGILNKHYVADSETTAAALGVNAGLDVELPDIYIYGPPLVTAVRKGLARQEALDESVRRILRAKFLLGLFERPEASSDTTVVIAELPAHRALAREAARRSIVLLKNNDRTLPFSRSIGSIAVVGPAADTVLVGGYSGFGRTVVTVLEGVRRTFGSGVEVRFSRGCAFGFGALPPIPEANLRPAGGAPGERGLKGEYFANPTLSGTPALIRRDPRLHFEWQMGSPDPKIPVEKFSARWRGKLVPDVPGTYRLGVSTDDGVRLYVDGKLLVNSWFDRGATLDAVTLQLEAGREVDLVVEYYENIGWSFASLVWERQQKEDPLVAEAVDLVQRSDGAVVVATIAEGEGYDRSSLDLPGRQEELINAVAATGKPTVVVLIGGSAVTMRSWGEKVGAIITAWYPGEEGGEAVAEVLAGKVSPGGRLPITFPQSVGQVPLYYAHKPTGRGNDYADLSGLPLFPFGHGLSYATFAYGAPTLDRSSIGPDGSATLTVALTNTGTVAADEVVQLYLRRPFASVTQPVRQLKGFRRISLQPGETARVSFAVGREELLLLDRELRWTVEPGEVELMVGSSSADIRGTARLQVRR
jgi:beta-glucosidase